MDFQASISSVIVAPSTLTTLIRNSKSKNLLKLQTEMKRYSFLRWWRSIWEASFHLKPFCRIRKVWNYLLGLPKINGPTFSWRTSKMIQSSKLRTRSPSRNAWVVLSSITRIKLKSKPIRFMKTLSLENCQLTWRRSRSLIQRPRSSFWISWSRISLIRIDHRLWAF